MLQYERCGIGRETALFLNTIKHSALRKSIAINMLLRDFMRHDAVRGKENICLIH